MRSAGPDPDRATSYPAAIAIWAIVVPNLPAPTMPRRKSPPPMLGTGACGVVRRRALGRQHRLNRLAPCGQQLADPRNHLAAIQLDRRCPVGPRKVADVVLEIKAAQAQEADVRGHLRGDCL